LILSGGNRFPWQLMKHYPELTGRDHFYNTYSPIAVNINCFAIRLDDLLALADAGKPVPIWSCFDSKDRAFVTSSSANDGNWSVAA